ncbi:MAG: cytochrome b subunit of formate dehydrogenase [Methylophilaceae bacterium]|jgi:cytochrome b subunit of formate dehydrogenase
MTSTKKVTVWDPLVRIEHWGLVIALFTAYFTEDDLMTQHIWAGYTVAGIISICFTKLKKTKGLFLLLSKLVLNKQWLHPQKWQANSTPSMKKMKNSGKKYTKPLLI